MNSVALSVIGIKAVIEEEVKWGFHVGGSC